MSEKPENAEKAEKKEKKKATDDDGSATPAPQQNRIKKTPWTLKRCQKAARRFHSEEEWKAGAPSSYKAATSKGWIRDCVSVLKPGGHKVEPRRGTKTA